VANFPTLKTGAVAQYPSDRTRRFSTQVCRFLDGSQQRFPNYGTPLLQWVIRLDWLDESELVNLEAFFLSEEGQSGTFAFTDPWDGTVYSNCSFDAGMLASEFQDVGRGVAQVVIKENR
jgi:hypothetical protein